MRRALLAICLMTAGGTPALSWGPGVHLREADRVREKLLAGEAGEDWQHAAAVDGARSCLHLGAIAPDFQWISDALGFGHAKSLSYAMIEASDGATACQRMFALGHLTHITSDASAETFFAPTLWASHPLGPYDLFEGQDDAVAETEGICEGVGDFAMGDWHAVVDLLYDFRLDGPDAWARGVELLSWYCTVGKAHHGATTDCDVVVTEVGATLARADDLLGGLTREDGHHLVTVLLDLDLVGFFELATSGVFSFITGDQGAPSAHAPYFRGLYLDSALVDDGTWDLYDTHFVDLGPHWTLEHLAHVNTTWPAYSGASIMSGNLQSMLWFLPEHFDPVPALRVDHVSWQAPGGATLSSASATHAGATLEAHVRLFGALPFTGVVRGVVKKDLPGLDPGAPGDPTLGQAQIAVAIDPFDYTLAPRDVLVVPFEVDLDGGLGFYLELYVDDAERPWFTTSWDRLWGIDALELDRPIYRLHWGTYGHWPPSLPVDAPDVVEPLVFVKAHVAPAGPPLPGASVSLTPRDGDGGAVTLDATANGLARFVAAAAGSYDAHATAEGYLHADPVEITVGAIDHRWAAIALHADLAPSAPVAASGCVPASWRAERTAGEAREFVGRVVSWPDGGALGDAIALGEGPDGDVCPPEGLVDGAVVAIEVRARYRDDSVGPAARSGPVVLDQSPPELLDATLSGDGPLPCGVAPPLEPPIRIHANVKEPHVAVTSFAYRVVGEPWREAGGAELTGPDADGRWAVDFDAWARAGEALEVRVTNAAGLSGAGSVDRLVHPAHGVFVACPADPEVDAAQGDAVSGDDDTAPPASERLRGGGCAGGGTGAAWAPLALLAFAALRRRPTAGTGL